MGAAQVASRWTSGILHVWLLILIPTCNQASSTSGPCCHHVQVFEVVAEGKSEHKRAKHTPVPQPSGAHLMLDLSPSLEESGSQELDSELQVGRPA